MFSCLRAEQYKVGVISNGRSDHWRRPLDEMLNSKLITFCCLLLAFAPVFGDNATDTISSEKEMPIFCYINGTDWVKNAIDNSELDAKLCSFIVIHATFDPRNWTIKLAYDNWEDTLLNDMSKLKATNSDLKFMLSVKTMRYQSRSFPLLVFKHHTEFVANAKLFIKKYQFDGIHIDWWNPGQYSALYYADEKEYDDDEFFTFKPLDTNYTQDNSNNVDSSTDEYNDETSTIPDDFFKIEITENPGKKYFLRLIQELKSQLSEDGTLIAVSIGSRIADNIHQAFDLENLKSIVDYWFIMAVSYNQDYKTKILQYAPVRTDDPTVGVVATVDAVKKALGPDYNNKLILTIGKHAVIYKIRPFLDKNKTPFDEGVRVRLASKLVFTYNGICNFVKEIKKKNALWTYTYNTTAEAPYFVSPKRRGVIIFENPQSFRAKTNIAINESLGGVMIYPIDTDDYTGSCSKENVKFPLLRTIYETIHTPSSETWKTYQMLL